MAQASPPPTRSEAAWAWVRPAYERAKEQEELFWQRRFAQIRAAQAAADATVAQAIVSATEAYQTAEQRSTAAADAAWLALKLGKDAYPEAVVGGGATAFGAFHLANGAFAPRGMLLVGVGLGCAMRRSLAAKWGDDVAAASKRLSDAVRQQAEHAGLLPPPHA